MSDSRIFGDFFEFNGQGYKDVFKLASLKNFISSKEYIVGDFEVGLDILDLSALSLTKSNIKITQDNYTSKIDIKTDKYHASFGIKTDGTKLSFDNIILNKGQAVNQGVYGSRNDELNGSLSSHHFEGGAGFDTISYYNSISAVNVNLLTQELSGGYAQGDTISSIENIKGSSGFNDVLEGDNSNNHIEGWGGNDTLIGNDGSDFLIGGSGNDIITDLLGYNDIAGGIGEDKIYFSASSHRIYGGNYGVSGGDNQRDEFILKSWHKNTDEIFEKGDVIGDFEVGIDILNLSELAIQASQVSIGLYENGYMVHINTGTHKLNLGIRTHGEALTVSDIKFS